MALMAGLAPDEGEAMTLAQDALDGGRALEVFARFVEAQGGDARIVDDPGLLPQADVRKEVLAASGGFVTAIDALSTGFAATALGAGRRTVEEKVDPAVGIVIEKPVGESVSKGEVVAVVHGRSDAEADEAVRRIAAAFEYGPERPESRGRLIEVLDSRNPAQASGMQP
jgi:thymidine phosphorylase